MKIFRFCKVTSTNNVAFEMLRNGESPAFAVIAEEQSNGHGRRGHKWVSNPGNIYLSFAVNLSEIQSSILGIFLQCFVLNFIQNMQGVINLKIKWPNDIFCNLKKIGGVLLETRFEKMHIKYAVLGVGVNVLSSPNICALDETRYKADALISYIPNIRQKFVEDNLIKAYDMTVDCVNQGNVVQFTKNSWSKYDIFFKKKIYVNYNQVNYVGENCGINENGSLVLKSGNEKIFYFNSTESQIIIDCS